MFETFGKWLEKDFDNVLMKSKVLRLIICVFGGSALFVMGMIIWNSWGMELCKPIFSSTCLGNFTDNMQLPIKLLTATIALSGFWVLIFRSHQTTEQIKTSQKQVDTANTQLQFNNYIAHKKAFMESMDLFEEGANCKVIKRDFLYKMLFPQNSFTNWSPDVDKSYLESLVKHYEKLQDTFTTNTPHILHGNAYQEIILSTTKVDHNDNRINLLKYKVDGFMKLQEAFRVAVQGCFLEFKSTYKLRANSIYAGEIPQSNIGFMQGYALGLTVSLAHFANTDIVYPKQCENQAFHQLVGDSNRLYRHLKQYTIGEGTELS